MSLKVKNRGEQTSNIVAEVSQSNIAPLAQDAAHFIGLVAMVYADALDFTSRGFANTASVLLRLKQRFVLLQGNTVVLFQSVPKISELRPTLISLAPQAFVGKYALAVRDVVLSVLLFLAFSVLQVIAMFVGFVFLWIRKSPFSLLPRIVRTVTILILGSPEALIRLIFGAPFSFRFHSA